MLRKNGVTPDLPTTNINCFIGIVDCDLPTILLIQE